MDNILDFDIPESTDALDHVEFSLDDDFSDVSGPEYLPLSQRYRGMTEEEEFYHSVVDARERAA